MNYQKITKNDTANGDGIRITLWVSGCSHKCEGCHNPQTWSPNNGIPFNTIAKQEIFAELEKPYTSGLTLSGGDPLVAYNYQSILSIVKEVKEKFPNKTIWCYTGYLYEEVPTEILKYIDVLVDGKYEQDKRDISLHWCGSSNQRVIDIAASRKQNKIVLYE